LVTVEDKIINEIISILNEQDFSNKRKLENEGNESEKKLKNEETSIVLKNYILKTKKIGIYPEKCRVLFRQKIIFLLKFMFFIFLFFFLNKKSKKKFLLLNDLFMRAKNKSVVIEENARKFFEEIKKKVHTYFSLSPTDNLSLFNRICSAFNLVDTQEELCFFSLEDLNLQLIKETLQTNEYDKFKMLIGLLDLWEFKKINYQESTLDAIGTPTILRGEKK
jgi:hypothetical protein